MSDGRRLTRLVVCIDGAEVLSGSGQGPTNESNVARLNNLIREGSLNLNDGSQISQVKRYYRVEGTVPRFRDRFKSTGIVDDTDERVKSITLEICNILESSQDEVYFFASGHGAYIARCVAGNLHHMGIPKRTSMNRIAELYQNGLDLYKARVDDDSRNGPRILQHLQENTCGQPKIKFVGLFDCVKLTSSKISYDTSFVQPIQQFRHAVAFNENRSTLLPDLLDNSHRPDSEDRSFIQAWFAGSNDDLLGGTQHDGLSLYPLQWMIVEAQKAGMRFEVPESMQKDERNPLTLTFPNYAGSMPTLDGSEEIEWRLPYSNGVSVTMFDLQGLHGTIEKEHVSSHAIELKQDSASYNTTRKAFTSKGLIGWNSDTANGMIIHASLYCILDKNPRLRDMARFKGLKEELTKFQENHMGDGEKTVPPWFEGLQLHASGVKAFRILVCGKTGVGKSTLINKIFCVEMTEESKSYDQGVHDIDVAFESPNNPGLLIHDSRGWQAGSDSELELIAKFLRHRAYQKDPAEALHVIWFCVDADVSRIEEADKRTFETIAKYSNHVPVFVVGTKKDKLIAYHKMQLLEKKMEETNNFKEATRIATEEADKMAEEQFSHLREQLSLIKHYKADGYCCVSKDDSVGIKKLLNQTLDLLVDERVRLFCVAAQVVDVDQKIDAAITECMRLSIHAIRTSQVPLPLTGMIGTPTVSRLIVEHILQCFGFPKAAPAEVEEIMSRIVYRNLKSYMAVTMATFLAVSAVTIPVALATLGIGSIIGAAGFILAAPPAARMLFKCAADMILILERSFHYGGKFVSVKQIEDAAKYYTTVTVKTFAGKEKIIQDHVHDQIDALIPLKKVTVGYKFARTRGGFEDIVYNNLFGKVPSASVSSKSLVPELEGEKHHPAELSTRGEIIELPADSVEPPAYQSPTIAPTTASSVISVSSPWSSTLDSQNRATLTTSTSTSTTPSAFPIDSKQPIVEEREEKSLPPAPHVTQAQLAYSIRPDVDESQFIAELPSTQENVEPTAVTTDKNKTSSSRWKPSSWTKLSMRKSRTNS